VGHVLNIPTKFHQDRPVFKKDIGLKPFVTLIHRKSSMFKNPQKVTSTSQSDAALARSLQSVSREAVLKRSTCGESFMGFTPERTERTAEIRKSKHVRKMPLKFSIFIFSQTASPISFKFHKLKGLSKTQ
jgi:hypothetical protein